MKHLKKFDKITENNENMKLDFDNYCEASKDLTKQAFGEELYNELDIALLERLIGVVFRYGLQQTKDTKLCDYMMFCKEEDKVKSDEEYSFIEYMEMSKKLMEKFFGSELYNKVNSVPLKPFKWEGIDITTSSILATTAGIKQKFTPKWVQYGRERGDNMLGSVLQSIFHYGFQFGMDTVIAPAREKFFARTKALSDAFDKLEKDKEEGNLSAYKKGQLKDNISNIWNKDKD